MLRRSFHRVPLTTKRGVSSATVFSSSPLLHSPKRNFSLMPLFEVAVEATEQALVYLNNSSAIHSVAATLSSTSTATAAIPVLTPIIAMVAFGFLVRFLTLTTFTMYSDRAQDRYATAMPTLSKHFLLYAEVAWNPHALKNEVEMAATKLQERRSKTMKKFKTSNLRVWGGKISSMLVVGGGCLIGIAVAPTVIPLSELNMAVNVLTATAADVVPIFGGAFPTVIVNAVASAIWLYNFEKYTDFRKGFWDQRDQVLEGIRAKVRIAMAVWVLMFTLTSVITFQKYASPSDDAHKDDEKKGEQKSADNKKDDQKQKNKFELSHGQLAIFVLLPFYIFGASVAGLFRFHVLHKVTKTALSSVLQWPRKRPKLHGTYGEYRWSYADHLATIRWAEVNTGEKKRAFENYERAKTQIEYECDARLQKMSGFKNLFIDSRYAKKPNMPAPPEDLGVVKGGRGGAGQQELPEGVELKTWKRDK